MVCAGTPGARPTPENAVHPATAGALVEVDALVGALPYATFAELIERKR